MADRGRHAERNEAGFVRAILALLAILTAALGGPAPARAEPLPALHGEGSAAELTVDGKPFLILGGELANSSASSLDHMAPIWPRLEAMNLNAVLVPVSWELIEPEEGRFDFTIVDGLLQGAREHDLRLVLLWFGSWKNSMSSYAPAWVKRDQPRFPRAVSAEGVSQEILTPFAPVNRQADARAFGALMRHLAEADADARTVILVQVENEIGMLPSARDHSRPAEAAWHAPVPAAIVRALKAGRAEPQLAAAWKEAGARTGGNWEELFGRGKQTEEYFMAWAFARYTEAVAAAGKAAYALPMYVNAALIRPGREPGDYPSAGPLPHLFDFWKIGASSIDFLAPDIYFPNFTEWIDLYARPDNPLFIPEANRAGRSDAPANAFYAFGRHGAIGFSPFSIDSLAAGDAAPLRETYDVLAQLAPIIARHRGGGTMTGFRPPVAFDGTVEEAPQSFTLGDWRFTVSFVDPWMPREAQNVADHGGLIVQTGTEDFLVAGTGVTLTFAPAKGGEIAGIDSIREGQFVEGEWKPGRLLNGDESHQGRHLRLPPNEIGIQRLRLYRYR